MSYNEISKVGLRNMRHNKTDYVDKMYSYFCHILYHATYITPVAATVIYKGLIQLPYGFMP